MRKPFVLIAVLVIAGAVGVAGCGSNDSAAAPAAGSAGSGGARGSGGGGGRGGSGMFSRPPMTVELTKVGRASIADRIMVVGNLIGAATVEVVPKLSGRLQSIDVRIGDTVRRGQLIAKVEDREIREQVRQAQASYEVSRATVRQREADLKFAQTNLDRSRNLFERDLVAKQTLDDSDARFQSAAAQLDLARAQFDQAGARLEELNLTLANTSIASPVDGFVGRRNLDPGAFVSQNSPVVSVVDLHLVRLVANVVEKDLRRITTGMVADVEVDAYPGEAFAGRVARLAPVLDPGTRTAQMEVEVPNPGFRLKPGMYARVRFTVAQHDNALVVPRNALVDVGTQRGVFVASGTTAGFRPVEVGITELDTVEVVSGLSDGDQIITTGAGALRDGDTIVIAGQGGGPGRGGRGSGRPGQGTPNQSPSAGGAASPAAGRGPGQTPSTRP